MRIGRWPSQITTPPLPAGRSHTTSVDATVAALVGAMGERTATVVGHDWGGALAWAVAALHPQVLLCLVAASMPHLLAFLAATRSGGVQLAASKYTLGGHRP